MHLTHKRAPADRSTRVAALPGRDRETALRATRTPATRTPLTLVGLAPDRRCLSSVEAAGGNGRPPVAATRLVVGWGRRRGALIMWLGGTLDRLTGTVLGSELDARAIGASSLVIDLTRLEFIDASGVETLTAVHRRVTERGGRLSFRHGQHLAQRPLGLIRPAQLRSDGVPRRPQRSNQNSYFALAMACADVVHLPLGDRPGAA